MKMTLLFSGRLFTALFLGAVVGLERQWRQRMAGTRTNALVAAGASAFVMAGLLLKSDPGASSRMASYVVSGVGFLGAGVIFKDSTNIRGLNTAATIWCSAAIGVLAALGAPQLSIVLAVAVIFTNTVLRPIAYRLHPVLPEAISIETQYEINLVCRNSDEVHLRALLLSTISQLQVMLQAIHSEDVESTDRMRIRAALSMDGRHNEVLEQVVRRLSLEPSVSAVSWSIVPTTME
jgi:putative Mg2+ transporter-C (MgtC) family protein